MVVAFVGVEQVMIFEEQVQEVAHNAVRNVHHGVRVECLKLIGQLSHATGSCKIPLSLLEEYTEDPDPRVRCAAFLALVRDQSAMCGGVVW